MATVKIGDVTSLSGVDQIAFTPDERQVQVQVLDGVVVQDLGYFDDGLKIEFSAIFRSADFLKLTDYWKKRVKVDFIDTSGLTYENCRVVLASWQYVKWFEHRAVQCSLKIWRT